LLREPSRRPPGFPDRPFGNGRPRTCAAGATSASSLICTSVRWQRLPTDAAIA